MLASVERTAVPLSLLAHFKTLKFTLLAAAGCIALILIADLTQDGFTAWSRFQEAKNLRAVDLAGNRLVGAVYFLLREQPAVNGAFKQRNMVNSESIARIAEYRQAGDQELVGSLSDLNALDFPNKTTSLDELQNALHLANGARAGVQIALGNPSERRDQTALAEYNTTMNSLIRSAQNLWSAAAYIEIQSDPVLTRYSRIKSINWKLREIAGAERSVVTSTLIAGEPMTHAGQHAVDQGRAQIQMGWQLVAELAVMDGENSPVKNAMAEVDREYFQAFQPMVDRMRKLSETQAGSSMSFIDWVKQTDRHIDTFLHVLNAAAKAGAEHAARLETDAFADLIVRSAGVVVAIVISLVCFFVVVRRVADPLARLSDAVRHLAAGRLDVTISDTWRNDEIGEVARTVDRFKANLIQTKNMHAVRDAERAAKENRAAILEALAKTFEAKFAGVAQSFEVSATQLEATSRSLSVSAEQTNRQSDTVAATARRTSTNVQAVAEATSELARSAQEIGNSVAHASQISRSAVDQSRHADATIQGLATAAEQIGAVLKLINNVADQTNLLALNATIEAARAGDAGRGFAVVAAEVKLLAGQTARATQEIDSQIARIQGATKGTIAAIRNMDAAIVEVDHIAIAISEAVSLQHAATQEIADKIDATAAGTDDVTQRIGEVQLAAQHTGDVANELLASASEVARSSSLLRSEVETFLSGVRQAS